MNRNLLACFLALHQVPITSPAADRGIGGMNSSAHLVGRQHGAATAEDTPAAPSQIIVLPQ